MQTAINVLKNCGLIASNTLVLGKVYFVPDKSNGSEDHATPKVSARKEIGRAAYVSPQHENLGSSTSRYSPFELRLPRGLPEPKTSSRCGDKAAVITSSSSYQRDLRRSPDKNQKTNNQSSTKKCKRQIFKNLTQDGILKCKKTTISGKSTVFRRGKTAVVQKCKIPPKMKGLKINSPKFLPTKALISP
jgi:hypothetical protein